MTNDVGECGGSTPSTDGGRIQDGYSKSRVDQDVMQASSVTTAAEFWEDSTVSLGSRGSCWEDSMVRWVVFVVVMTIDVVSAVVGGRIVVGR